MIRAVVFPIIALIALSCHERDLTINQDDEFTAIVITPKDSTTCGLPLITITDNIEKLHELTASGVTTFNAHLLNKNLSRQGLKHRIKIRKTRDDELTACLTLGIMWPWVTILDARIAN